MIYIAVVGGAQCSEVDYQVAYEVGTEIARHQAILICGGGGGVMEAASKGTAEAGGCSIGILPGDKNVQGNRFLSYAVATGLGEARNAVIARTADLMIAVGGEYGTLSEIALALKMGKPVIAINSWQLKPPAYLSLTPLSAETAAEALERGLALIGYE
ncbi:MAG: TIGR00725 family protein [Firmicutes bacterium]|nr:TIGR00725 family protein [Bacillota bacterium]